jgi:hypothetical protein
MNDSLLQTEELKRNQCWNQAEQWRVLQETIAWIDSQQDVPRNSPAGCMAAERVHASAANAHQVIPREP